jgi:hypothetical protein
MKQLQFNLDAKQLKKQLSTVELQYEQAKTSKKNYVVIKRLRERMKKIKEDIQMLHG